MILINRYFSEIQSSETIHEKTALIKIMEAHVHILLPSIQKWLVVELNILGDKQKGF
jgi:hypothetical protein